MSIKSSVAPVRGDGKGEWVLGLALAIGRKFNAHIDVLHFHATPEDMIPFGVPLSSAFQASILDAAGNLARQEEDRLVTQFDEFCRTRDLHVAPSDAGDYPADCLSISWHEEEGKQADVVRREVRFCDLIVTPRPDRAAALGMNSLQAALFELRKLTAVAPHRDVAETGRHVAIAWNGGAEAARAVTATLPILAAAEKVSVLVAEDADAGVGQGRSIQRYLRLHGVESGVEPFRVGRRDVGAALLAKTSAIGADMIVMGAFGARKRSELVLGGVTQFMLENAEMPLVMAH